ncbi:tyrosinase family protein [Chitinimonas koreensis]|uniref:tyrosinase family protein n=1 Tax=Chitinimonas koreensis TaxID=356302 RepID=UPI0004197FA7|nr:tyrosinase family protein [Chitinimonas koreensis]QNM95010.1 tyrosinase family protein [Chitinimonas koreensis]
MSKSKLFDAPLARREILRQMIALGAMPGLAALPVLPALADDAPPDYPEDCTPPTPTGPAVPFVPGRLPVLPRRSINSLGEAELRTLTLAFARLRELTVKQPDNPLGWLRQSYVHCWYCGGGTDGQAGPEIHGSWWFLPWHRCYLYFLERILARLAGAPELRLPYWDWSTQSEQTQTLPLAYSRKFAMRRPNALYNTRRGVTYGDQIPKAFVGPKAISLVLDAPSFGQFGGMDPDVHLTLGQSASGLLERIPHNNVHNWTGTPGDSVNQGCDMGVLATAARDPVFFAHHANVDRMWPSWLALGGGHDNPTDERWLDHAWNFYDENGTWTSIKVRDVVETAAIGYVYDSLAVPTQSSPVFYSPERPPRTVPAEALSVLSSAAPRALSAAPTTHVAALPQAHRDALAALAGGQRYLLTFEGVRIPAHVGVAVKVYVNLPKANAATSTELPNYVGLISSVAKVRKGEPHGEHKPERMTFVINVELARKIAADGTLQVTLVPITPRGRQPASVELSYETITLAPL